MNSHCKTETTLPEPTFVGVDVSKSYLDSFIPGVPLRHDPHTPEGRADLIVALNATIRPWIICEASGGYERSLVAALMEAGMDVSVVPAGRVRHLAKAQGLLAKTDRKDAKLIAQFGEKIRPRLESPIDPDVQKLRQILEVRSHHLDTKTTLTNRLEHAEGYAREEFLRCLSETENRIAEVETLLNEHLKRSEELNRKSLRLQQIKGVGPILASTLLAYVPELGQISNKALSALIGVAPHPRDSGEFRGQRRIGGGRGNVRKVLYMGAIAASTHNPILKGVYHRLKEKGKPTKVALVAVMRKLLGVANRLIADPQFSLA